MMFHGNQKAPLHKCAGALLFFSAHDAGDEDLQTDADEDDAAEDGGFAGEFGAELFADGKAGFTDEEGDGRHDEGADQSHEPAVLRDGEAHRQRVDAGGDTCMKSAPALSSAASSASSPLMPSMSILPPM